MATDPRFDVPAEIAVRVAPSDMRAASAALFEAMGMARADAVNAADVLVYADERGIDSHGVSNMFPVYRTWFESGHLNPRPTPRIVAEAPAVATIDDDRGLGLATCHAAMRLAIDKARDCGIGSVAVANSGHFGAAAYWAHLAIEHDMIGVALTVGGLQVLPTFGARPMVGLNPIAVAAPAATEPPFVFDASMSSVAGNKIRIAKRLGVTVAPGWIAETDGSPILTESPVPERFHMLPLGGTREGGSHKGYGLATVVDILAGILSGNGPGFLHVGEVAHHFVAYRLDAFGDPARFKADMDDLLRGLRDCPTAPGEDRVVYAGLPEFETQQERQVGGIPYHPEVLAWFRSTAVELGCSIDL
ncbi:MAG: Ldh family oxidoreductase [Acidimicrobiia bacterium]|nr:Ldh family oxidoreductase [Acidimicrobiia bacterium]